MCIKKLQLINKSKLHDLLCAGTYSGSGLGKMHSKPAWILIKCISKNIIYPPPVHTRENYTWKKETGWITGLLLKNCLKIKSARSIPPVHHAMRENVDDWMAYFWTVFDTDPDPAFMLKTDPDPEFWLPKIGKNLQLKKKNLDQLLQFTYP